MSTCLAVCATIRPKSDGVSTHSEMMLPSSSSSCANTVTSPLVRSMTTRASSPVTPFWRLYALASAPSSASMTVSKEMPFSRSMLLSASISTFIARDPPRRGSSWRAARVPSCARVLGCSGAVWMCGCVDVWMCGCVDVWMCGVWTCAFSRPPAGVLPGQCLRGLDDLVVGHLDHRAVDVQADDLVVGAGHAAAQLHHGPVVLAVDQDIAALDAFEGAASLQRMVHAR